MSKTVLLFAFWYYFLKDKSDIIQYFAYVNQYHKKTKTNNMLGRLLTLSTQSVALSRKPIDSYWQQIFKVAIIKFLY